MLRLRITLLPPLAPLRALFLVEPATQSIGDLKAQLGRDLQQLSGRIPNDLGLEVDGWELLDSSGVALVREDDVISVKLRDVDSRPTPTAIAPPQAASTSPVAPKRKRTPFPSVSEKSSPEVVPEACLSSSAPPTKKTKLTPPPPDSQIAPPSSLSLFSLLKKSAKSIARVEKRGKAPSTKAGSSEESDDEEAHQSDSSSSSESSSSSSASSSSSSSSGSSSSSSSSGDSSAPSLRSSKPTTQPKHSTQPKPSTTIRLTPIIPSQPPVPPGEGSSATRERNLRRRKKAAALKAMGAASASASPAPSTTANQTPQPTDRASCSADAEMEDVDAALRVLTPDFLPTQPDQEAVTASFVAAATRANPDPTLAISYTTAANRNKSKAFKKAAAGGLAGFKTLFDSPVSASAPATPASAPSTSTPARLESAHSAPTYNAVPPPSCLSTPTTSSKKRKSGRSSLVPSQPSTPRVYLPAPSDRPPTSLPKAMFVSSVDVEDPVWEASVGGGVWAAYLGLEEDKVKEQVWENGAMQLDYGTEEAAPVVSVLQKGKEKEDESAQDAGKTEGGSKKKVDLTWDALDELYEGSTGSLPWENLKVGSAVIYKELVLDPNVLTPHLALHYGQVVHLTNLSVTLKVWVRYLAFEADDGEMYDELRPDERAEEDMEEKTVGLDEWKTRVWRGV